MNILELLRPLDEDGANFRYAEGKWSIKELLGHLIDTERVFGYRAMRIARADSTPLPGFEQDDYVLASNASNRDWQAMLDELELCRLSHCFLLDGLAANSWTNSTLASGWRISFRALVWIMSGHIMHHHKILLERYGL